MLNTHKYNQESKAALFDWLVFGISFSMGFIFTSLKDFVASPGFTIWMLAALLLYTIGAALKHLPLRYRLGRSGKAIKEIPLFYFLLAGHFCIFCIVVFFSEPAVIKLFASGPAPVKSKPDNPNILRPILAAIFVTWLIFRPKRVVRKKINFSANSLFIMELVADIFLVAGVSILSFAFWEKGIFALLTRKPVSSIGDVWFLFVFLSITYILFYLPLRYLFLIEDYQEGATWKRLLLIFGLLLLKSLLEILRI
jgi:hypothetical protein